MKRGGWILMHDIDLPDAIGGAIARGEKVDCEPRFGAKYVFDSWPGPKFRSGNIGAIQIPQAGKSLGEFIARMRNLPSEVTKGSWIKQWRVIDELIEPRDSVFLRASGNFRPANHLSSSVLLRLLGRNLSELICALGCSLGVRWAADSLIFLGQMVPRLLIARHDLGRAFEGTHRLSMSTLFDVCEPKMFPDRSII